MTCEIHLNDIGTQFILTVKDCLGNVVDISSSTDVNILFQKPNNTTLIKDAALYTDGTDGKIVYTIAEGDLDMVGSWKIQANIVAANGEWNSSIKTFKVSYNLPL